MILDDSLKTSILLNYCKQAVMRLKHKTYFDSISTECPFCGTKKLKGTIFKTNTNRLCYICWRASCVASKAMHAKKWLKKVDPALLAAYEKEVHEKEHMQSSELSVLQKKIKRENELFQQRQNKELLERKKADTLATKSFVNIQDGTDLSKRAISYCKQRHIPEEIWKKFYISHTGKYHDRLIIPFYNKDGKIEYFQGRSLFEQLQPKYLNRNAETHLYNRDFVDELKPVIVLEGPIDSMFVENAVATCGANSSGNLDRELAKFNTVYYLFDNDEAGNRRAGELVRQHKHVFMWNKFLLDLGLPKHAVKDVNDLMIKMNKYNKYTIAELSEYFTNMFDEFECYL